MHYDNLLFEDDAKLLVRGHPPATFKTIRTRKLKQKGLGVEQGKCLLLKRTASRQFFHEMQ